MKLNLNTVLAFINCKSSYLKSKKRIGPFYRLAELIMAMNIEKEVKEYVDKLKEYDKYPKSVDTLKDIPFIHEAMLSKVNTGDSKPISTLWYMLHLPSGMVIELEIESKIYQIYASNNEVRLASVWIDRYNRSFIDNHLGKPINPKHSLYKEYHQKVKQDMLDLMN